ncbi:hypothetical protein EDC94DRAFT_653752 [Helicostylum pulchrum]|nr:hypothetical protein EDC94DRAFT_653752 [Helicostylum pulchrum]
MQDLPVEIYTKIFLYLERIDYQTCYFVCKSWYTMAIPLGWEAVILRDRNISRLKLLLNNLDGNQYFKHSHLTTTLAFRATRSRRDSYTFNKLELLELLKQLPNLKEIDFKLVYNPEEYVGYLLDADMQHINHIDIGFNLCDIRSDLLFSVYYKFRNSLTCISLVYDRNTINSRKTNISNLLTRFKKLTKLELYNIHDINLTPFQIQDSCPNLELLVFDSRHPISDSAMQHILDDNRRINLNFISSLTCLNLYLPSLSVMYTRYLVDYFPNQLTDLHITISRQNIFNWIDIVGMDLALRLMEKAGGIDETYVRFILREEYQERSNDENNMTKYFKLLNSFRGTRQTHCAASFNEAAGEIMDFGHSFQYFRRGVLCVRYDLYRSDLNGSITDVAVPDKASSIIGPEIFDVLKFNLLSLYDDDDVYRVLNYSLSNCPRLQSLSIIWRSREYLESYLSLALTSSNRANCDIDVLQMENITLTKNLADLVTAHFHDIEIISLRAADWDNPVIDLVGFEKLKSVKYTSTNIHVTDENKFVLIKYTDGIEEQRILEYGKTKGMGNPRFTVLCDTSVSLYLCTDKNQAPCSLLSLLF